MRKTSRVILVTIIATSILLGLGYAAIQNITLNISGMASADPNQANFKVKFTGTPVVSDSSYLSASITNDTNAIFAVSGLTEKGQKVTSTYDIINESNDLSADLIISITNSNMDDFEVKSELGKTSLVAGEMTTVTVTVELTKTLISNSATSDIGIEIIAVPVEPGKEGSSGVIEEPEYISLSTVSNDDIGEYIDIGNNFVGTDSTSDDWRIVYRDDSYVYAILADYLVIEKIPTVTGLDTNISSYPYSIWSDTSSEVLLDGIKNQNVWSFLTNGIDEIVAQGAIDAEMLLESYNYTNNTTWKLQSWPVLSRSKIKYDLYVPKTNDSNGYQGYWLAKTQETAVWACDYTGEVGLYGHNVKFMGVRPVIKLPISLDAELNDNVWIIKR